jgi:hypothetical protein
MSPARLAGIFLYALPLIAQPLTQRDRDFAMSNLHATRKMYLDVVTTVSDAQWNYKPSAEIWSIGEIAEHLALAETGIFMAVTETMKQPAQPEKRAELSTRARDEKIVAMLTDRSHKAQAPEQLRPAHKFASREALIDAFRQGRDTHIAFVRDTTDDLRSHSSPSPFGDLDAYQWILFLSGHTERHVLQMREVMARPDFPHN